MSKMLRNVVIFSGVSLGVGITASVVYHLVRKWQTSPAIGSRRTNTGPTLSEVKLEVSRDVVGYLIGKRGATISRIREETGAHIRLEDRDDELTYVYVRGNAGSTELAVAEIKKIIDRSPANVVQEMVYPYKTWASIIGVNGEKMRYLSQVSKALLTVKGLGKKDSYKVTIKGTKEQVQHAISLIDGFLAEDEITIPKESVENVSKSKLECSIPTQDDMCYERFESKSDFVQVFVSAAQSPSDFWVQICGPKSVQLDKLVSEMSTFYGNIVNKMSYALDASSIVPGIIVAAFYDGDGDWYRGKVTEVHREDGNVSATTVTVLFIDFGDSAVLEVDQLCKLKTEYLLLPVQGIHCCLQGVKPVGEQWEPNAVELFKVITFLAQWKVIMAKPVLGESGDENHKENDIVNVLLVDTNGQEDVDMARELVKAEHAVTTNATLV